jgi:hypothetical protein
MIIMQRDKIATGIPNNIINVHFTSTERTLKYTQLYFLPVTLCAPETWSPTLREQHRLWVFENGVLMKTCGSTWGELTGDWGGKTA